MVTSTLLTQDRLDQLIRESKARMCNIRECQKPYRCDLKEWKLRAIAEGFHDRYQMEMVWTWQTKEFDGVEETLREKFGLSETEVKW